LLTAVLVFHVTLITYLEEGAFMNRLVLVLSTIVLGTYTAFGMGTEYQEPASPKAQEGKVVYIPINPAIKSADEQKIQQDDQNITGQAKAK
jgi:hypothetical protein